MSLKPQRLENEVYFSCRLVLIIYIGMYFHWYNIKGGEQSQNPSIYFEWIAISILNIFTKNITKFGFFIGVENVIQYTEITITLLILSKVDLQSSIILRLCQLNLSYYWKS